MIWGAGGSIWRDLCGRDWDRGSFGCWGSRRGVFCDFDVLLLERRGLGWKGALVEMKTGYLLRIWGSVRSLGC